MCVRNRQGEDIARFGRIIPFSIYCNSMSLKKSLVWLLLVATLFSAWAGVLHAHGDGAPQLRAVSAMADADPVQEDGAPDVDGNCHCLWCAPQLHAAVAACNRVVRNALLEKVASPSPGVATAVVPAEPRGSVPPPRGPPLYA